MRPRLVFVGFLCGLFTFQHACFGGDKGDIRHEALRLYQIS